MSVQLIVYPQSYDGLTNSSNTSNQFFVDGINFNNVNASANTAIATTLPQGAISYYNPTMAVNTWYRYYDVDSANVYETGSFLSISSLASEQNGIIQKISNLTVGAVYDIQIDFHIFVVGTVNLLIYSGTTLQSTHALSGSTTQTIQFTANSTEETIVLDTENSALLQIDTIGVTAAPITPSGAIQLLEDGQVICDLYEDEDLPLTLSVDDFKNVAEKVQSYSKAFNLPSTKRNNKIFNAIFEVTRENDGLIFNPYKRTKCVLKQDGFILFEGYLRLLDVTDKEGEISYNVNLYAEVIALADTLQDRVFRDLDFTEIEHEYNRTQIKNSWNDGTAGQTTPIAWTNSGTSGFRTNFETVKYPFVDWDHQILIGPGTSGTGANPDNPRYTALEQIFRPFISIKYLVDRIFEATDFTYESAFFDTTDFKKLFMDFNWGANDTSTIPTIGYYNIVAGVPPIIWATTTYQNFQLNDINFSADLNYDSVNHRFEALNDNTQYNLETYVAIGQVSGWGATIRLTHKDSAGNVLNVYGSNYSNSTYYVFLEISQNVLLQQGDTLQVEYKADSLNSYWQYPYINDNIIASIGQGLATTDSLLQNLRGELGQWDFLKGLITMFNLVTLVDEDNPNNILIEPYTDVFIPTATTLNPLTGNTLANRGIQHDWTDKIDVSEMKLTPLTDLNKKTIFKFVEDDDDYSFNQYKNQVGGHLYGSKKFNAGNEFNILDGEEEVIAEPFAATVVKPLMDNYPLFIVPSIYAINNDVEEGFENSPRIMYNNGIKPTGASYYIPEQNGVVSSNEYNYLQFSHIKDSGLSISGARDFHFGECQLLGNQVSTVNNLFNLYWLPYYSELYNPNTRTMTLKVNLSPADINTFKFNDRVFIKNRVFRVNKIDYKPNDLATVEFILIP